MSTVTLLSRPGCHLCDEARAELLGLRSAGAEFDLEEVDIESSDELLRDNLELIPVIIVDGERVSELVPDMGALRARLGIVAPRT